MFHIYKKNIREILGGLVWGGDRPSPTASAALPSEAPRETYWMHIS